MCWTIVKIKDSFIFTTTCVSCLVWWTGRELVYLKVSGIVIIVTNTVQERLWFFKIILTVTSKFFIFNTQGESRMVDCKESVRWTVNHAEIKDNATQSLTMLCDNMDFQHSNFHFGGNQRWFCTKFLGSLWNRFSRLVKFH